MVYILFTLAVAVIVWMVRDSGRHYAKSKSRREVAYEYFKNEETKNNSDSGIEDSGSNDVEVLILNVAGVHVDSRRRLIENYVDFGDEIELRKEPRNKYNSEAIAVHAEQGKIGYIYNTDLPEVHEIFDRIINCVVSDLDGLTDYITVEIEIYYTEGD